MACHPMAILGDGGLKEGVGTRWDGMGGLRTGLESSPGAGREGGGLRKRRPLPPLSRPPKVWRFFIVATSSECTERIYIFTKTTTTQQQRHSALAISILYRDTGINNHPRPPPLHAYLPVSGTSTLLPPTFKSTLVDRIHVSPYRRPCIQTPDYRFSRATWQGISAWGNLNCTFERGSQRFIPSSYNVGGSLKFTGLVEGQKLRGLCTPIISR